MVLPGLLAGVCLSLWLQQPAAAEVVPPGDQTVDVVFTTLRGQQYNVNVQDSRAQMYGGPTPFAVRLPTGTTSISFAGEGRQFYKRFALKEPSLVTGYTRRNPILWTGLGLMLGGAALAGGGIGLTYSAIPRMNAWYGLIGGGVLVLIVGSVLTVVGSFSGVTVSLLPAGMALPQDNMRP